MQLDNVIKLDKQTDFVGREALRRVAAEGTPRLLVTLRIQGDEVPEYGAAVTLDGSDVDRPQPLSSPTFDMEVIGMATVNRALATEGQRVDVALGDGTVNATVAALPLYDTAKRRPAP